MRRKDILELMSALGLRGMKAAYDEVLADAARRNHPPERVLGTLLKAEVADKKARSIKYQLSVAKLPTAKELDGFDFTQSLVEERLLRQLADGSFCCASIKMRVSVNQDESPVPGAKAATVSAGRAKPDRS